MFVLNGTLSLGTCEDVEALCIQIIEEARLELDFHDYEDCLSFLIGTAWLEWSKHEAKRTEHSFHFKPLLKRRLIDWRRARMGRTRWQFKDRVYERQLPSIHPLEDRPDGLDYSILDHLAPGGLSDVLGLQRARGSTQPGRTKEGGGGKTRAAA